MRKLTREKRALIISLLIDGNGINATSRISGAATRTVLRLLNDVGLLCAEFHDVTVRNVEARNIQVDEVWAYAGCKDKSKRNGAIGHGSIWTWVALDSLSKLIISFHVGDRSLESARTIISDLKDRVANRIQLSADGLSAYETAVRESFGDNIDFGTVTKSYGNPQDSLERRYSPAVCTGCKKNGVIGYPDVDDICTSHIERAHLSLRLFNRRYTRLTLGFSKKVVNHIHALNLSFFASNFIKRNRSIGTTPACFAKVADREWSVLDLVDLLEREERLTQNGGRLNKADRA